MAETSIDFLSDEKFVTYFSNVASEMRYMRTLIGHEGVELMFDESDQDEGGIELRIPKKWYKRPRVPSTRVMSEEHKQKVGEALAKYRADKMKNNNQENQEDD